MSKNIIEKDFEETTMEDSLNLGYNEFYNIRSSNDDDDDYDWEVIPSSKIKYACN